MPIRVKKSFKFQLDTKINHSHLDSFLASLTKQVRTVYINNLSLETRPNILGK